MGEKLIGLAAVFLGGGVGAVLRWAVSVWADGLAAGRGGLRGAVPWGTAAVNVVGSLAIGLLAAWVFVPAPGAAGVEDDGAPVGARPVLRLLVAVGVLGGFTTFSGYALEAVRLIEGGRVWAAWWYASGSAAGAIAASGVGWWLGGQLRG